MRVAMTGAYPADPSRIPGGIATVAFYLVQGLRKYPDLDIHIVTPNREMGGRTVEDGNVTMHFVPLPNMRIVPNQLALMKRTAEALDQIRPDLVHGHLPPGVLAGLKRGYPTIYTVHGIKHLEIQFERTLNGKLGAWLEARMARQSISGAKHCIAIADYVTRVYADCGHPKWHRIFNPIPDKFFDLQSHEIEGKMFTASLIYERKNLLGLVRAFERIHNECPSHSLYMCGKVLEPDYYAQVQEYVKSHDLSDAVHLLGFISQDELERHFSEASVICMFSNEETAPMLLAQAMCAGKAVIASKAGGIPDMVVDGETGFLVDTGDEEAFARRSLELLSDPALRRRMGLRAREVAEQRFRTDSVAAKTLEVYREVLSEQGPKTL